MSSRQEVLYSFDLVFLAGDVSDIMLDVTTKMYSKVRYNVPTTKCNTNNLELLL